MNTQTLELDLSKDGLGGNVVRVGQGDKRGTTIKSYIYDNGAEAALTGYTGYLEVLLPNKRNYYRATCSVSGNVATVTVDEAKLCSVAGYTDEAYFTFEKSGIKYSTERFAIEVLRNATDGQQPAQSWDDVIGDLILRGSAAVSAANSAATSANAAATRANSAATSASAQATSAASAASAANGAAAEASSAATAATSAASSANAAATKATSAATSANGAATSANGAANAANAAANRANGAADDALAAGQNAMNIANSIAAITPSGTEVAELDSAVCTLGSAVANLKDAYVLIGQRIFVPKSRVASSSGEKLSLNSVTDGGGDKLILN